MALTVGYVGIAAMLDNNIVAAPIAVCLACLLGKTSFFGTAAALLFSTYIFVYMVLYSIVKSQGIEDPLSYIYLNTPLTTLAYGLVPFAIGILTFLAWQRLSNKTIKADEMTAGGSR